MRLLFALLLLAHPLAAQPDTKALATKLVASNERFWSDATEPKGNVTSRGLFAYAFALCEAEQNPERLERIFELAAQMQDRDPQSKSYGNFKWRWDDKQIVDFNAVEFSMRAGSLLWLKHKEKIPAPAKAKLLELLNYSVEGLLRHRVSEAYTNIALMNSSDLILLGEALGRNEVANEGYKRFERVLIYTYEFGIHEYVSPTYYGPDLDALVAVERFAQRERGREQARALLEFFWTDIALNWFAPAQRLAGAHSRSYDYLSGLGELDIHLQLAGWLEGEPNRLEAILSAQCDWFPSPEIKKLREQYPRLVRQRWGVETNQWRTHYVQKDVTLSTAGASYGGRMDFPLTVDFPGDRKSVRCYFTSDGRGDPYGKVRIAESATHSKALHLNPFWAGAQNEHSAVGLVLYRDKDIPPDSEQLESHFVMPLDNDGLWIGDKKITFEEGKPATFPVPLNGSVVLRKNSAALGLKVVWENGASGGVAPAHPVNLAYDGNTFGAIRLTITHYRGVKYGTRKKSDFVAAGGHWMPPIAALVVRVGSNLAHETNFENWRKEFINPPRLSVNPHNFALNVAAAWKNPKIADGTGVVVGVRWPINSNRSANDYAADLYPAPSSAVLALNGEDIGKRILEKVEPIKSAARGTNVPQVKIPDAAGAYFEAESGQIMPAFEIADDANASGGKYVWMPGEPGKGGGSALGSMSWKMNLARSGEFYLWGRTQAATPDDDSFFVRVFQRSHDALPSTAWSIGTSAQWEWVRFAQKIALPQGETQLQLRVREDGAKIDRLFITRDPNEVPK
jgi:hypothetical protein